MSNSVDLNQLHAFVSIAKHRSITIAADHLHLTQPAVTKRLQQLEQQLDIKLFDRVQKRMLLTESGKALLPEAKKILDATDDLKKLASNLDDHIAGQLCIATSHHIGLRRLPPILKRYRQLYPEVKLDIRFMDSEKGIQAVQSGDVELAIVTLPEEAVTNISTLHIWNDPLLIVTNNDHELATLAQQHVKISSLLEHPVLLPEENTQTYQLIRRALKKQLAAEIKNSGQQGQQNTLNLPLNIAMTNNAMETLKMLTTAGFGWTAIPQTMIDASLSIIQTEAVLQRNLGLARHSHRTQSNAAKMLESMLLDEKIFL